MFWIREYRRQRTKLSDYLPWFHFAAPGVVLNKDGAFQRTFRFRGPDLDSATEAELIGISAQINNVFKRLAGGWAIFADAVRYRSQGYPDSTFPDPVTFLIDYERNKYFDEGHHFESAYYLTIYYLPPAEREEKLASLFIERQDKRAQESYYVQLRNFMVECDRIYHLLREVLPEIAPLDSEETLTYLHSCVSPKRHRVRVPEIPIDIDGILADTPLMGGLEPRLGKMELRIITILGFPGSDMPGILDELNRLGFPYRWSTRFIPMDKIDAQNETKTVRRKLFANRKGVFQLIQESLTGQEAALVDTDSVNKALDADAAYQAVSDDLVSFGFFTATVTVMDPDPLKAEKYMREVEKVINGRGFTTIYERENAVDAWIGSLPGHTRANIRRPLLNSMNLAHLFPLSAVWAGPEHNRHLKGPALIYTQTHGNTPFRFDLHVRDVGHTMIVGPTGGGKSVLLATISAQFCRYHGHRITVFDKDGSIRVLTAGVGGRFYDLANEENGDLSFQPLANVDNEHERTWATGWLEDFLVDVNVAVTPEIKADIWEALSTMGKTPKVQRHMTALTMTIQNEALREAFQPLTKRGAFGHLFDATADGLEENRWQVFEMGQLMQTPRAVGPALGYLFHRLEQGWDGRPQLVVVDECWAALQNPQFAEKFKDWLKTARKKNVAIVFATQSLQDILNSKIAPVIMDSCPTKIFLPNLNARDEEMAKAYRRFGLNSREIEIISMAVPKRHYYYKSEFGSRLFELALRPVALAYCGSSSKEDQAKVQEILDACGLEGFNPAWLEFKGLKKVANDIYPKVQKSYQGGR